MLSEVLVPVLKERFPDKGFVFPDGKQPFAVLDCPCPDLGRLEICDDDDEVTVYITKATHGHFGCYLDGLSREEKEKEIAGDVLAFLEALFADRVVVFRILEGFSGGWKVLKPGQEPSKRSLVWSKFLWSGPLHA